MGYCKGSSRGCLRGSWRGLEGVLEGVLEGGFRGRLGGRLGGGLQRGLQTGLQDLEGDLLSSSGQSRTRSDLGQVWFSIELKFNSFELDSEVGRLVLNCRRSVGQRIISIKSRKNISMVGRP